MSNYALRDKNLHYKIQEQAYNLVGNDYRNKKIAGKDSGKKKFIYYYARLVDKHLSKK